MVVKMLLNNGSRLKEVKSMKKGFWRITSISLFWVKPYSLSNNLFYVVLQEWQSLGTHFPSQLGASWHLAISINLCCMMSCAHRCLSLRKPPVET